MSTVNDRQAEQVQYIIDELWDGRCDLSLYREVSPALLMAPGTNGLSAMDIAVLTGNKDALATMLDIGACIDIDWWSTNQKNPWLWALQVRQRDCLAIMLRWLALDQLEAGHSARITMLGDILAFGDMGLIRLADDCRAWKGHEQMLIEALASQESMMAFHDWSPPFAEKGETVSTMAWLDHWLQDCMQMKQFRESANEIERLVLELACTAPNKLMANVRPAVITDPRWRSEHADAIWNALRSNQGEEVQATQHSLLKEDETMKVKIYDLNQVDKLRSNLATRYVDTDLRKRMDSLLGELRTRGEFRRLDLVSPDYLGILEELDNDFPNFVEVIAFVRETLALSCLDNRELWLPPIMLAGDPGIGKTHFARCLADRMGATFLEVHMENEQNGSALTGSSEFWSNTQTGQLFTVLTQGSKANPIVLVDELDKASGDERFNPVGGLYQLLERDTASRFCDQSVKDLTLDASHVSWILTANDLHRVPAPIMSRMTVFDVPSPTQEESMHIARRIFIRERTANGWGRHFVEDIPEAVLTRLGMYPPRRMRTVLRQAFGRAAIAGRAILLPADIGQLEIEAPKPRIGFIH